MARPSSDCLELPHDFFDSIEDRGEQIHYPGDPEPDRHPAQTVCQGSRAVAPSRGDRDSHIEERYLTAFEGGTVTHRKALLHALVAEVRVKGRNSIQPIFRAPTRKVRLMDGLVRLAVVRLAGIEPATYGSANHRSVR